MARRTQLENAADALAMAVWEYVSERENPAPDMLMRRVRYEAMMKAHDDYAAVVRSGRRLVVVQS